MRRYIMSTGMAEKIKLPLAPGEVIVVDNKMTDEFGWFVIDDLVPGQKLRVRLDEGPSREVSERTHLAEAVDWYLGHR